MTLHLTPIPEPNKPSSTGLHLTPITDPNYAPAMISSGVEENIYNYDPYKNIDEQSDERVLLDIIFSPDETHARKKRAVGILKGLGADSSDIIRAKLDWDKERASGGGPSFGQAFVQDLPENIGGLAGGGIGAAMTPQHPWRGGVIGAGIGQSAGELIKQAFQLLSQSPNAPQGVGEAAKRAGSEFAWGAGGEGGARVALKALKPFAKSVLPMAGQAMDYFSGYGGQFLPGQLTTSRVLDTIENIADASLTGGPRISVFKEGQKQAFGRATEDIAKRFGTSLTKEEIGEVWQETIEEGSVVFRKAGKALYKNVDELAKGKMVNIRAMKAHAKKILDEMIPKITEEIETPASILDEFGKPIMGVGTKTRELMPSIKSNSTVNLLQDIASLPDEVPFNYLNQWQSDLMQIGYQPTDIIPKRTAGIAKLMATEIDFAFDNSKTGLSPEARQALDVADEFWKNGKKTFNHNFIKNMLKKNPDLAVDYATGNKSIVNLKKLEAASGDAWPEIKETLSQSYINGLLQKSVDKEGMVSGVALSNMLKDTGDPILNKLFEKEVLDELNLFAYTAKAIQSKQKTLGGGMLIQLKQSGALIQLLTPILQVGGAGYAVGKGQTGKAATIMMTPYVMARILTSPKTNKWLTQGLTVKKGTEEAIRIGTKLLPAIMKAKSEEEELPKKTQPVTAFTDLMR